MRKSLRVEESINNHFLYFKASEKTPKTWKAPQEITRKNFDDWLKLALAADVHKWPASHTHYYLTIGTSSNKERDFFMEDLAIFSTKKNNFFVTNVQRNKGIQCRFGMRGIIAESHYDAGKNMVAMLKGAKRYILNPPEACPYLKIVSSHTHPSYR